MQAVAVTSFDEQDPVRGLCVGEQPDPQPGPGWAVIEVRAAALNHHDLWSLRGVGLRADQLPMILGAEAAGITADGRAVITHAVVAGDDGLGSEDVRGKWSLLSESFPGTQAQRVAVPAANLIDKPAGLSFVEAACLPVAWLTAYRMLFGRGGFRPGQTVLVQGAGGGVATAAVLLGRAAGLTMWVTSRSPAKAERAVRLGAARAFAAGERLPRRVDGVVETVGAATWAHSVRSVRDGGTIVVAGATSGSQPPADLSHVFYRQLTIAGTTMGTRQDLRDLLAMLAATGVRPVVGATYPLAAAAEAYARLAAGDVFGKVVLTVAPS